MSDKPANATEALRECPREPTEAMYVAGRLMQKDGGHPAEIWRAMYDAAPVLEPPKDARNALAELRACDKLASEGCCPTPRFTAARELADAVLATTLANDWGAEPSNDSQLTDNDAGIAEGREGATGGKQHTGPVRAISGTPTSPSAAGVESRLASPFSAPPKEVAALRERLREFAANYRRECAEMECTEEGIEVVDEAAEGMYGDKCDDVNELCDALKAIATLCGGHDDQSRRIVTIAETAIREHGGPNNVD